MALRKRVCSKRVKPRAPWQLFEICYQFAHTLRRFFFICCSYVNNLKLHDVILTDQRGVVLKITTQYDTEPKVDSNNFQREVAHVWGIRSLPSSSLDLRQLKVRMVVLF